MISATITVRSGGSISPYSREDMEEISKLSPGEYRAEIHGSKRTRSVPQLRLFWACCRTVADNCEHFTTAEDVARQLKVELKHFRGFVVDRSGVVHVELGSISFDELDHLDACRFFDRAWPIMAEWIGTTVEEMHANTRELEGIEEARPSRT